MSKWQPALARNAHQYELQKPLDASKVKLFGKLIHIQRGSPDESPGQYKDFCGSGIWFRVKEDSRVWMCEHEILTD